MADDLIARIEAALARGEAAAARLERRHAILRQAARETLDGLDRLIEVERRRVANG
jgi:hypothetical protein